MRESSVVVGILRRLGLRDGKRGPVGITAPRLSPGTRPLVAINCPADLRNEFASLNVAFVDLVLKYLEAVEGILLGHLPSGMTTGVTEPLQCHQ